MYVPPTAAQSGNQKTNRCPQVLVMQIRLRSEQMRNRMQTYKVLYAHSAHKYDHGFDFVAKRMEWESLTAGLLPAWIAYTEVVFQWMNANGRDTLPTGGAQLDELWVNWRAKLQESDPEAVEELALPVKRPHVRESVHQPQGGEPLTQRQRRAPADSARTPRSRRCRLQPLRR